MHKKEIYTYAAEHNEVTITGLTDYGKKQMKLIIPDHIKGHAVTSIGFHAFVDCKNVQEVQIPATVKLIDAGAFSDCKNLKIVNILGETDIANGAFEGCESLVEFHIVEGQSNIQSSCFYDSGLSNINEILKSTDVISDCMFLECVNIQEVVVPGNVRKIQYNAFGYCYSLKEIVIPDSVEELEDGIFWSNDDLTIITSSGSKAEQYAIDHDIPYEIR